MYTVSTSDLRRRIRPWLWEDVPLTYLSGTVETRRQKARVFCQAPR